MSIFSVVFYGLRESAEVVACGLADRRVGSAPCDDLFFRPDCVLALLQAPLPDEEAVRRLRDWAFFCFLGKSLRFARTFLSLSEFKSIVMKKKITVLVILFIVLCNPTEAQITKVKNVNGSVYLMTYKMKSPKLLMMQYNYTLRKDDMLTVYNDDFSEYKVFTPSGLLSSAMFFPDVEFPGIDHKAHITQHFFNSDDKLEMIVGGHGFYAVINEDGNELCRLFSNLDATIKLAEIGTQKYIIVDSDNNDDTEIFRLDTEVNAAESIALSKVSAYPNPAGDHITFTFNLIETSGTLQVSDLSGRVVLQQIVPGGNQSSTIKTYALQSGTYIARLISEGKEIVKEKFIVK